jgi:DNA-binding NarL/FixJ family response regulator
MAPTRILLIDMPRMLREIIESTLASEPDMDVVGAVAVEEALAATVDGADADVIVVGAAARELVDRCRRVMATRPLVKVLAVASDARSATLYELEPATHALGELSPRELADAIRRSRRRRLTWSDA